MEVGFGIQLLLVAGMLAIFAAAISDTDSNQKEAQREGKSQRELVKTNCIAMRMAGFVGLLGLSRTCGDSFETVTHLLKMLPASPAKGFATASAEVEISVGVQLLLVS